MPLRLSILDQSPIFAGTTPAEAVASTLALARRADGLGYHRYWLAEHHAMRGLADAAPEILLARIGAETERIRIGTGGVLLPHYRALKVAEQFRMLEALTPGRVDLGIGRAPGGTSGVSEAMGSRDVRAFPRQVEELVAYLHGGAALPAMPAGPTAPPVWLLGSSDYSAALAAHLGLPFAFAHFISGDAPAVTRSYRRHFIPGPLGGEPQVIVAFAALCAPSVDEAEDLAAVIDVWRLRIRRGVDLPVPSLEEARSAVRHAYEVDEIAHNRRRLLHGTPAAVRERIETVAAAHAADEAMLLTITPDAAMRERSYDLLADAFALATAA